MTNFPIHSLAQVQTWPHVNLLCSNDETYLRQQIIYLQKLWRAWCDDERTPRPVWMLTTVHDVVASMHYSHLKRFWETKRNKLSYQSPETRYVASTQRDDVIAVCHAVFGAQMQYHRIDKRGDKYELVSYDNVALAAAIEFNIEWR